MCHFRQALALDERRVRFWPEYANESIKYDSSQDGDVKEVWFAGSHSDMWASMIIDVFRTTDPSLAEVGVLISSLTTLGPHCGG